MILTVNLTAPLDAEPAKMARSPRAKMTRNIYQFVFRPYLTAPLGAQLAAASGISQRHRHSETPLLSFGGLLDSPTCGSASKDSQLPEGKDDHEDDEAMRGGRREPESHHNGNETQHSTCTCMCHHNSSKLVLHFLFCCLFSLAFGVFPRISLFYFSCLQAVDVFNTRHSQDMYYAAFCVHR